MLQYGEIPCPPLDARSVLIRVKAISVEGGDLYCRRLVPPSAEFHVGGYQAAGVVEAIGSEVVRFVPGDRVVAFHWSGSHAELMSAPEATTYAVPSGLGMHVAATVPVAFGTANDALFELGRVRGGDLVLIHGAAGGVGIAAVQLAVAAGARVLGTSSSEDRLAALRELGVSLGINYLTDNILKRVMDFTAESGVDAVLDMAGGRTVRQLISALRYRGVLVSVGNASGEPATFDGSQIIMAGATVHGLLFGKEMAKTRVRSFIATVFKRFAAGELTMPIARVFPLAHAAAAHHYMETDRPFGKIILEPDSARSVSE